MLQENLFNRRNKKGMQIMIDSSEILRDQYDSMISNLLRDAKREVTECENCWSKDIKVYFDYSCDVEEWIEGPSYVCAECDDADVYAQGYHNKSLYK